MDIYTGVRWSAVSAWSAQAIQLGISIVLARLLRPEDYGLLAMATVFIGFLGLFKTMGFGTAVIQRRELNDTLLSSLFYLNLAVACLLAVACAGAAPLCAWIYRDPRVTPIMVALAVNFPFSASAVIPSALLNRRMSFDRIAIASILPVVISGGAAIWLAARGWGVWALVTSSIVGTIIETGLFHALCRWHPRPVFRWSEARSVFHFGANVTGFGLFNYFARNADQFIIGAFLGAQPLGFYSLAYGIMLRPRDAVTSVLGRVLFPAFSRMQDDDARLKAAYLRACGAIAFVTFPMMAGLFVVARPFVEVVLGAKWLPALPLIYVFAPMGVVHSVGAAVGHLFLAKGRADWQFHWGVFASLVLTASFFLGLPWGPLGVAVSYSLGILLLFVPGHSIAFRLVKGLRIRDLLRTVAPYALQSGTMACCVAVCQAALASTAASKSVALILSVLVGVIVYAGLALLLSPPALADFLRMIPRTSRSAMPTMQYTGTGDGTNKTWLPLTNCRLRSLVAHIPIARRLSPVRARSAFLGSKAYWEQRYASGDNSGAGSYGELAEFKARFLNSFVRDHGVESVIEFGCGDGNQLSLAIYPRYIGLDVSSAAVSMCVRRFAHDPSKSFFLYDGHRLLENPGLFRADVSISLDVIYHLVEDDVYESYMMALFAAAKNFVIIYSTNQEANSESAAHVRDRHFTSWVAANARGWALARKLQNPFSSSSTAPTLTVLPDFYVFENRERHVDVP